MSKLSKSNWESEFDKIIKDCDNQYSSLNKSACEKTKSLVNIFGNLPKDAQKAKQTHFSKTFETEKSKIVEDMSFYKQQCNSNFKLLSNKNKIDCFNIFNPKTYSFWGKFVFLGAMSLLLILFILLANLTKFKTFWISLSIIFFVILMIFLYKLL